MAQMHTAHHSRCYENSGHEIPGSEGHSSLIGKDRAIRGKTCIEWHAASPVQWAASTGPHLLVEPSP